MFVFANLLEAVAYVLNMALGIYMWLIIARAVISWVNPDPYNPIVQFLYRVTEPVMGWLRRRLPLYVGGVDFSPLLVILIIVFCQYFVVGTLSDWAKFLRHGY